MNGMGAPATPDRLSSQAIEPRKLPRVSPLSGFNPCRNGMRNTISQKTARSCCAQNGFVQHHGYAVALAAQGRRGWPCAVVQETIFVADRLPCDCPSKPPSASRAGQSVKGAIRRASRLPLRLILTGQKAARLR